MHGNIHGNLPVDCISIRQRWSWRNIFLPVPHSYRHTLLGMRNNTGPDNMHKRQHYGRIEDEPQHNNTFDVHYNVPHCACRMLYQETRLCNNYLPESRQIHKGKKVHYYCPAFFRDNQLDIFDKKRYLTYKPIDFFFKKTSVDRK